MSIFLSFTPLFWYKLVFMGELLVSEALFVWKLRKRRLFALRASLCAVAVFTITFFFPIFAYNAAYTSAMFVMLFAVTIAALRLCFDEPSVNVLFCSLAAYTTQHLAYEIYNFVVAVTGLSDGGAFSVYGETPMGEYNGFTAIAYADCYIVVYWLMYMVFGTRIPRDSDLKVNNKYLLSLSAVIVLVDIVLSVMTTYASADNYDLMYVIITAIYNLVCCLLAMAIQFGMLSRRKLERELDAVLGMWKADKEHYELAKANIDIINVKCHDLKHRVRSLRRGGELDDELREIEDAVLIYDSVVKTGNESLDVVLTEKSLYCEQHGIRLTCMADGSALSVMSPSDIYSLFGNALDNAIEYVKRLDSDEKRIIRLSVRRAGDMLGIHVENWFEGEPPEMKDGLPVTTKDDAAYHGFGTVSMKMIAQKYGGNLFFSVRNGMFSLDAVIPVGKNTCR